MSKIRTKIVGSILSSAVLFSFSCAEKPTKMGEAEKTTPKTEVKTGWEKCLYPQAVTKQEVYEVLKPFLKGHEVFDVRKSPIPGVYEVVLVRKGKIIPVYIDCNLEHFFYGKVVNLEDKTVLPELTIAEYKPKTLEAKKKLLIEKLGKEKGEKIAKILGKEGLINVQFINSDELPKDNNVVLGNPEGKIQLYSFEEPECIHCAKFAPLMEKILKKYPQVRLDILLIHWKFHPLGAKVAERVICEKDPKRKVEILEKAFEATRKGDKETLKQLGKECKFGNVIAERNWLFFKRNQIKTTPALILPNGIVITDREILEDEKKLEEIIKVLVS